MTATITSSLIIRIVSGTGVTLDGPPVPAISTDDIYNPHDPSQTLTEMLDLLAEDTAAARDDAAEALTDSGATSSLITGSPPRPGDAPGLFGQTKTGSIDAVSLINPTWVATSTSGNVIRVQAPTGHNPQTIAPIAPVAVDTGRLFDVRWRVQRQTNPTNALTETVVFGIFWLAADKSSLSGGTAIVANIPLVVADGVKEVSVALGNGHPFADLDAPVGAIYFRPFIDLYGISGVTDIIALETHDITTSAMTSSGPLFLPLLEDDLTTPPGNGRVAVYATNNPDTSANLRMQVGNDVNPVDIIVNVGSGG